jgi:molecular chaperone DnaK (HSP70)
LQILTLLQVTESLSHSLGIETLGDKMGWILKQGAIIPCSNQEPFTNTTDNQNTAAIILKQGDNRMWKNKTYGLLNIIIQQQLLKTRPFILLKYNLHLCWLGSPKYKLNISCTFYS